MAERLIAPFSSLGVFPAHALAGFGRSAGRDAGQQLQNQPDIEKLLALRQLALCRIEALLEELRRTDPKIKNAENEIRRLDGKESGYIGLHWGINVRRRPNETVDISKIAYSYADTGTRVYPTNSFADTSWRYRDFIHDGSVILPDLASQLRNPYREYMPYTPVEQAGYSPQPKPSPQPTIETPTSSGYSGDDKTPYHETTYYWRTTHGEKGSPYLGTSGEVPEVG